MLGRAPGVSIVSATPAARPVAPARTDVAAFVGIASRGPLGVPVRVTAFREFELTFGSFTAGGFLAYAVKAFFENGGIAAWIVRAAAPAVSAPVTHVDGVTVVVTPALPTLAGTLVAFAGMSIDGDVAFVVRTVVAADAATGTLTLDAPLTGADPHEAPALDITQPLTVSTGAVAARGTVRARNGAVAADVRAASPGAWGNALAVRVMDEVVTRTTVVDSPLNATDRFAVASIARIARGDVVRLRQGTQAPAYRAVADVDAVHGVVLVHSDDASRALDPSVNLRLATPPPALAGAPTVVDVVALRVLVLEGGTVVEDYDPVSPLGLEDLAAQLLAANSRITIDANDLAPATLDPTTWLADVDSRALGAGTDGARMLSPDDLLAALAALAPLREPTLIAIPDACARAEYVPPPAPAPPAPPRSCTDPSWLHPLAPAPEHAVPPATPIVRLEAGPVLDAAASSLVAQGLVAFCETGASPDADYPPHPSFRFALVDVPWGADPLAFRAQFDATRAAIHWPWAGVYDPLGTKGAMRFVPPSGHVAGVFAATDVALGVHHSAANSQLRWIVGVAQDIDNDAQAPYNDAQINCIRALPNRGIRVFGARTLASDADWLYVPVRRLVSMIESAILLAMQWAVFEPSSPTLRALVRRSCLTLLDTLWQSGAFAGASQSDAYFVTCDGTNNPPATQSLGELIVDIGVAPVRPAEFIVFRVGHQQGEMEIFEGAAA